MKTLLNYLKIIDYEAYTINDIECYFYNFNGDKLLIALKTEKLDDVTSVTSGLLDKLDEFKKNIINQENLTDSVLNKNNLSMFLWDLYVICFYPKYKLNEAEVSNIHRLERDKYLARKIIINYCDSNLSEMEENYNKLLFPEKYLNEIKINETEVKKSIDSIDIREYWGEIRKIEEFLTSKEGET